MPGILYQLGKIEWNTDFDAPGATAYWQFTGSEADTDVLNAIYGTNGWPQTIPLSLTHPNGQNCPLQKCLADHEGNGVWNVTAYYGPIPPLSTGLTIWEIDTTGGREKRYQSIATSFRQQSDAWLQVPPSGGGMIDFEGAIGVSKDSVEGVETSVPKLTLTAKRKYNSSALAYNYVQQLYQLTAKTNQAIFFVTWQSQTLTFQIGELLFLGAVVTEATASQLEIDHKFEASYDRLVANGNGITAVGFSEPLQKYGWDYGWLSYMDATSSSGQAFIKAPQQFQSDQVYDKGDFSILQI